MGAYVSLIDNLHQMLMFYVLSNDMKQKLRDGVTLVVDRYACSGAAFTAAKGVDMEWCKAADQGLPAPGNTPHRTKYTILTLGTSLDLLVHLDLAGEEAEKRNGYGIERYEVTHFQQRVRQQVVKTKSVFHLSEYFLYSTSVCTRRSSA
jgi:dTMP kinase